MANDILLKQIEVLQARKTLTSRNTELALLRLDEEILTLQGQIV